MGIIQCHCPFSHTYYLGLREGGGDGRSTGRDGVPSRGREGDDGRSTGRDGALSRRREGGDGRSMLPDEVDSLAGGTGEVRRSTLRDGLFSRGGGADGRSLLPDVVDSLTGGRSRRSECPGAADSRSLSGQSRRSNRGVE
jgi:hypothetical protein